MLVRLRVTLVLLIFLNYVRCDVVILILADGASSYSQEKVQQCRRSIEQQFDIIPENDRPTVLSSSSFGHRGHHAVWPILPKLLISHPSLSSLLLIEAESTVSVHRLLQRLQQMSPEDVIFEGFGLRDDEPVITHHFYGATEEERGFEYPDFAAGVLLSGNVARQLVEAPKRRGDFTIDAKHEFARVVKDVAGVRLSSRPNAFCLRAAKLDDTECLVLYKGGKEKECANQPEAAPKHVAFAVKTYSKFHQSRAAVVRDTWGALTELIVYYSDEQDDTIPTVTLGIANTDRGHCAKTLGALKDSLTRYEGRGIRWIVVADDDTLVSVTRLLKRLRCYDPEENVILGERYGYGFNAEVADSGYDYPTGGAGMIFSLPAARLLVHACRCPSADAPDDMIIGACARDLDISVEHVLGMHQARSMDYAPAFFHRTPPITLHKYHGIDPHLEYEKYLHEPLYGEEVTVDHNEL